MSLILSTMFLMLADASTSALGSTAALNRTPQLVHSNMPTTSLGSSLLFDDVLEGIGHVFTGAATSVLHFGHLAKPEPPSKLSLTASKMCFAGRSNESATSY
jgi:hypothetical protein